jgi:hypothetical protein
MFKFRIAIFRNDDAYYVLLTSLNSIAWGKYAYNRIHSINISIAYGNAS